MSGWRGVRRNYSGWWRIRFGMKSRTILDWMSGGCGRRKGGEGGRITVLNKSIRVGIDAKLLKATDDAGKRQKVCRSELIREALRQHLKHLHMKELDARDRRGYEAQPQTEEEIRMWENVVLWPEG